MVFDATARDLCQCGHVRWQHKNRRSECSATATQTIKFSSTSGRWVSTQCKCAGFNPRSK